MNENAPISPPSPVRGDRLFVVCDRLLGRLDGWLNRWLPAEHNPLAQAGAAANVVLFLAVASGVLMLLWYSPSHTQAHASLDAIRGRTLGNWVRAVHRYASDLMMLLVLWHALRVLVARKFTEARWLPWVTGIGMIALIWFIGWTGFWLVWDEPAQQIAVSSIRIFDALPIFGEPLGRLFLADRLVPSLLFFVVFFLHMLLPLGMAVGMALHLARLSRARLLPSRPLSLAVVLGVMIAAVLVPAPLDEAARMAQRAEVLTVDAWYMTPLALSLRFQSAGPWVAMGAMLALAMALPLVLRRKRGPVASWQAVVEVSRCHACTQCVQDCPFDAIEMVARTDGKRFKTQAQVDPARCVGCGVCAGSCDSEGIGLGWLPTKETEAQLVAQALVGRGAGEDVFVALVAQDIDGGVVHWSEPRWARRLPGYRVLGVPTASWVRPMLVEQLHKAGVRGVLAIRDGKAESWARDGHRWVEERLAGKREPMYRANRAGEGGRWRVVEFDASRPQALTALATQWRSEGETSREPVSRGRSWAMGFALALLLGSIAVGLSHLQVKNPASVQPEWVFSFKVWGEWQQPAAESAEEEAKKPIHMRGRPTGKPHRARVRVRVSVDGLMEERSFLAKGISADGPAINEWRASLTSGKHNVRVEIFNGAATQAGLVWEGEVEARERWTEVLTYDPADGFRRE